MTGWPLLPLPDADGALTWPDPARSVRDTLRAILSTRPGEQLMRPDFGGGLDRFLHAPNTVTTRRQMRDMVQQAITRWERRIMLDAVEVWEVPDQPASLRVEIQYRLARNGAINTMNVSVQLEA